MNQIKLCDLVKKEAEIAQSEDYIRIVRKGKYLCNKCGRVAKSKQKLCKPKKIKKKSK